MTRLQKTWWWILVLETLTATASAALVQPGDLAFIGFNADGEDDFAVVLFAEALAGTTVRFSDNEWVGTGFNSGEGFVTWTLTETLAAGTVVTFSSLTATSNAGFGPSSGILSGALQFAVGGESLYAYVGPSAGSPTAFLSAISTTSGDYNTSPRTLSGTGLVQGTTAILLPNGTRGGAYNGARSGKVSFAEYVGLVGDVANNWSLTSTNGTSVLPFDQSAFAIQSVATPEPTSTLMMGLAALGLGAAWRRQHRQQPPANSLPS